MVAGAALAAAGGAIPAAGASVRAPLPEAVPQAVHVHAATARRSYVVRAGQYLSEIAGSQCGNPADWQSLYDANRGKISDPDMIYPGERLVIDCSAGDPHQQQAVTVSALGGTLGCAQLESLWEQAGGSSAEAFTAAEIAMAESGGNQYATGTVGERGYWQINPDHGSLSTYDPLGNARAAVILSDDGRDFSPWTTYTGGLYVGRC
jgi:hypothetical protein